MRQGVIKIQSFNRGLIQRRDYQIKKEARKEVSAIKIQSMIRMFKEKKKYRT